ncbi:unnamed protein product [Ilex paraguariensis]|uniref:6-phosphogluconate dehydrogenase NADP-binding domain-containing protein n=1 Tax=Ilex paraguariensis TaxID=185542 RepID=A0ABC8S1Z2_9AQUA
MSTPYLTPITPSKTRIGWIGIGVMGSAMASRLLSAGYTVTIYARTPSKSLSLQSQGAQTGLLSGLNPGGVIVDSTSNDPALAKRIFETARSKNFWAVDAPVSGLVFAEKTELDVRKWMEAVRGGAAGSMVMELFGERIIGRGFRPGGFTQYIVKDLGMGLDVGEKEDDGIVVLPGAALTKQLFSGMVANGDGKVGIHGLITVIERINGK